MMHLTLHGQARPAVERLTAELLRSARMGRTNAHARQSLSRLVLVLEAYHYLPEDQRLPLFTFLTKL